MLKTSISSEATPDTCQGPSVAYMKGQEGALYGPLARKRLFRWTYYTYVLSPDDHVLYQYRTELVSLGTRSCHLGGGSGMLF